MQNQNYINDKSRNPVIHCAMQQTRTTASFSALSAGVFSSVKKGRLFERSEFLPFSPEENTVVAGKAHLEFSLVLSLFQRTKKER